MVAIFILFLITLGIFLLLKRWKKKPKEEKTNATSKDWNDFELWAFGSGPFVNTIDMMKSWNTLHGDKLMLDPTGSPGQDVHKMIKLWREHGNI